MPHFIIRFSNAACVWVLQLNIADYFKRLCSRFLLFGIYNNTGCPTNKYITSKIKMQFYLSDLK